MFILCQVQNEMVQYSFGSQVHRQINLTDHRTAGTCCQNNLPMEPLGQRREQRGLTHRTLYKESMIVSKGFKKKSSNVFQLSSSVYMDADNAIQFTIYCSWEKHSYPLHTHSAQDTAMGSERQSTFHRAPMWLGGEKAEDRWTNHHLMVSPLFLSQLISWQVQRF